MNAPTLPFSDMRTIGERFAEFCEANPDVFEEFKRLAWEDRLAGCKRISADELCHVLRRKFRHKQPDSRGYTLNNDFTALFARKLIAEDGSFAAFFETRKRRAE